MEARIAEYAGSTEELLREAIRQMYADIVMRADARELLRLMISEGYRIPELTDFFYRETFGRGVGVIRMIIWRGIALGEFRHTSAAEFPHLIAAPCKLVSLWQLIFGDRHGLDLAKYADAHADFVLAALRAH